MTVYSTEELDQNQCMTSTCVLLVCLFVFFIILFFICQDYTNTTNGFPRNVDGGRPLDLNRLRYGSEDRDGSGNFVLTHKVSAYERELLGLSGYMHSS